MHPRGDNWNFVLGRGQRSEKNGCQNIGQQWRRRQSDKGSYWHFISYFQHVTVSATAQQKSGAYSEGSGVQGAMHPQSSIEWIFFTEKAGFVGTVHSTRSVLWTSNMPIMRWRPGLCPGPHWRSSRRSPRPSSRLRMGTPPP